ncbi:MAG: hypothetical protein AAF871_01675 [Pseudomonadota bacterium]
MSSDRMIEDKGYGVLRPNDYDVEPALTEMRLAIEAFLLNWGDINLMMDRYFLRFSTFPADVGVETVGRQSLSDGRRHQNRSLTHG